MRKPFITSIAPWLLVLLLLVLGALLPTLAAAQAHTLRVAIQDAAGRGLVGITVIVRSEDGRELARAATDATGTASFADLPAIVRIAVEGQARGGPRLFQLGDDAQGVRFELGQEAGTLDLRVERDGLVLPDPATMLALEEGGPVVEQAPTLPTAALATPIPSLPTSTGDTAEVVRIGEDEAPAEPRRADWVPAVTLLLVVAALGVLRLLMKLRSAR
jgi:hypothetical protein